MKMNYAVSTLTGLIAAEIFLIETPACIVKKLFVCMTVMGNWIAVIVKTNVVIILVSTNRLIFGI